jgi:hypothetical protein
MIAACAWLLDWILLPATAAAPVSRVPAPGR